MTLVTQVLIALVALLHIGFLLLEMLFWDKPRGMKAFNLTPEFARESKTLAANQGLYNGFLAAGLAWSLVPIGAPGDGPAIATFFLGCVIVAGIFGAMTVSLRILAIQAAPAALALASLWLFG
ncbi:MAG: DUF1304 domain-containing protein [Hyphomicrobiaceae bacterium]|nr:DUF1304 domain-containing protein [Hyphomicrobiaceae bacterium]